MQSKVKEIEKNTEFPCLMEFYLTGDIFCGVYLVNQVKKKEYDGEDKFSVCQLTTTGKQDKIEMYFKDSLNPKEWFHLPKGTQVILTN